MEPLKVQVENLTELINNIFTIMLQLPDLVEEEVEGLKQSVSELKAENVEIKALIEKQKSTSEPSSPLKMPPPALKITPNSDKVQKSALLTPTPANAPPRDLRGAIITELKDILERRQRFLQSQE
ncbi:MAG TPA: hypothetical protein VKK79_14575 [Candidatus Lokiarchaeia archaeon]|nr:hypothetical protein [Candidatus Lokiarchaeia archaeon]